MIIFALKIYIIIYNKSMNKVIVKLLIVMIILSLFSCMQKNKTITLADIEMDIPEDFKAGFLDGTVQIDNTVAFHESYGVERHTAIYTIVYTKYKPMYSGMVSLEKAKNNVINGLRNHYAAKEFRVVSEEISKNLPNSYEVLSSFYYGPNKTYHKSLIMMHDNGILQIMCMYNANSKKDEKTINNIIQSVRIITNN
ncbi:hypothetical protein [uncultured Brachyspira sp.]|uniref:hypothetical protein n=3 Tax=uncultured Brachyspira sp. TaxID=221953 RepID=UPI0026297297|nr:hypothetical protein [uncultured Brachyspira sp.]